MWKGATRAATKADQESQKSGRCTIIPKRQKKRGFCDPDILALKHESRILRHFWDVKTVSNVFLMGMLA